MHHGGLHDLEHLLCEVAHDLRAPLNTILLTAELLLRRDGRMLTDDARVDLNRVVRMAAGGERLILDILDGFRSTSAGETPCAVDTSGAVAEVIDMLHPRLAQRDIRVRCEALPAVWGRPSGVRRVFANLVENATRSVPDGHGSVRIRGERDGDWVVLRVEDNGPGIPVEYRQHVFQLFGRVPVGSPSTSGASTGNGIGLAIVRRIVEEHGGSVGIESARGPGACFVVRLPAADARRG